MAEQNSNDLSFADALTRSCPFDAYDEIRDTSPVYLDPITGNYVLTQYHDVRKALLNHTQLSNRTNLIHVRENPVLDKMYAERGWVPIETLVNNDPPGHTFYRALVDKVFTRNRVAELEADIEQIAHDLISSFEQRDEIEFLDAFAIRLPLTILADQLGVAKDDIETFKFWTDVTIELVGQVATPEREVEVTRHVIDMQNYLAEVIERVRKSPNESIISRLANVDVEGRTLTMRELMGILQQLLVAGNDTTTATLGSAMKLLVEQPEYVDRLRTEPALIPKFVDEALRLRAAVQVLFRRATEELEIHGVTIPKDAIVEVRFGAANLDPEVFENPAAIDLERDNGPQHLAFGAGKHFCIGNQLARAEVRIALGAFIERLDNFKFSRGEDSYNYLTAYIAHGVDKLWMSFDSQLQKS